MKKCFIVLGMHRSGTSALMGVLKALSIEIGLGESGFIKPAKDNIKGFFELVDVVNLNNRILKKLGSSWDSLYPLPECWWQQEGLNEYKDEILRLIETNFKDSDIISIKDPRLCRLLPLWADIFEKLGINAYYIISLRQPLEIANSLKIRDRFTQEKSLLLWMTYMLDAEFYSRKYPRVFITYDRLLNDTANTIDNISLTLDIKFPKKYEDVRGEIAQFLDSSLKHHNQDTVPGKILSEDIFNFYRLMIGFVGKSALSNDDFSEIDNIRDRYFGPDNKIFYNRDVIELIIEREAALERLEKQLSKPKKTGPLKRLERNFRRKLLNPLKNKIRMLFSLNQEDQRIN